ncbi:DNA phosphorothioation-dependent restriction protein DptF [Gottfriedia acidiceleris]|uniref:DNA phosphorothioation-dependent restriction protein DptF n=1 Tax=Gottfriedia acidiceleris TaxID=371036 RepID=UPI003D199C99
MTKHTFEFLQEINPELAQIGKNIDKIFYVDPNGVLVKGRLFAEQLSKEVVKKEAGLDYLLYVKQVERIEKLDREGLLSSEIAKRFDSIRYLGNKAAHENLNADLEKAIKMHKNLFEIAIWFMELYGDHKFVAPIYSHPIFQAEGGYSQSELEKNIINKLSKQFEDYIKLIPTKEKQESDSEIIIENEKDEHNFGEIYGSSLIYELTKLKESSQEAVENANSFSSFKKYLHVERPIQKDLHQLLLDTYQSSSSQLIILGGSVGDGKSHMLAYMNSTYPEILNEFSIHNDATESFDPMKNSLDTLAELLLPFSDEKIEQSNEKKILAINLGVLHNFLTSKYANDSYTKLVEFIEQSMVFDSNVITNKFSIDNFHLISFSDYQPFELTEDGPQSSYFKEILSKITNDSDDNPFYQAYLRDNKSEYFSPVIMNYQLLMRPEVQENIAQLLVKALVKHKMIVSTRALLNFIHDMIVPSNIHELIYSSIIDETEFLLPNLLFGSSDKSQILNVMSKLDPIHLRSQKLDQLLIDLNLTNNISSIFKENLNLVGIEKWTNLIEDLGAFYELSASTRKVLMKTYIRMTYCFTEEQESVFNDCVFNSYMKSLFAFNAGNPTGLQQLYKDVLKAVFEWKGQPKRNSNYIYIDDSIELIKIAQSLSVRPYSQNMAKSAEEIFYSFKKNIVIGYQEPNSKKFALLEIDYPLYEKILMVLKGYRPNKKDKEDAIQFVEFIDKLMKFGNKNEQLLVHHSSEDLRFKLEYDGFFGQFTFVRE